MWAYEESLASFSFSCRTQKLGPSGSEHESVWFPNTVGQIESRSKVRCSLEFVTAVDKRQSLRDGRCYSCPSLSGYFFFVCVLSKEICRGQRGFQFGSVSVAEVCLLCCWSSAVPDPLPWLSVPQGVEALAACSLAWLRCPPLPACCFCTAFRKAKTAGFLPSVEAFLKFLIQAPDG